MGICRRCLNITMEPVCSICGDVVQQQQTQSTDKQEALNPNMIKATQQAAATIEQVRNQPKPPLVSKISKIPPSWLVFLIALALLSSVLLVISYVKPSIISRLPVNVSSTAVISTLHDAQTLNVLEEMGNMTCELTDPRIVSTIFGQFQLPGGSKTIKITYDYKIAFGIDLGSVTKDNIRLNGKVLTLLLPKPIDISVESTNDDAKVFYGAFGSIFSPSLKSIQALEPRHDDYTTLLRKNTLENLKKTGRYAELQNKAMIKTQELIAGLLQKGVRNDIVVKIDFF